MSAKEKIMEKKYTKIMLVVLPLVIALLSFFVVARYASSPEFNKKTIQSLDDKKTTVMELTAASTVASAAISLIPGDGGTPIAEKLADLSSYFLVVICAIYLEKYLVTITGYAAFSILIPLGCVLFSAYFLWNRDAFRVLAEKLLLFGLAVYLVIPASVKVADLIDETYQSSIESTIDSAKQATSEIESETDTEENTTGSSDDTKSTGSTVKKGLLSGIVSKVEETVSGAAKNVENVLNRFIEALAVMLVTSCLIPILVLVFFVWLVKMILGVDLDLHGPKRIGGTK